MWRLHNTQYYLPPPRDTPGHFTHDMRAVLGEGQPLCFRTDGAMFCRCPITTGMFSINIPECEGGVTMYPQMRLIKVKEELLDIKHVPWGEHFWQEVLRSPFGVTKLILTKAPTIPLGGGSFIHLAFTGMNRHGAPIPCSWICRGLDSRNGKPLLVNLGILQKAIKRVVRRRRAERTLAVMMGLHERLGAMSLVALLPADLLASKILMGNTNACH